MCGTWWEIHKHFQDNLMERGGWWDRGVDGRILLKWILRKEGGEVYNVCYWWAVINRSSNIRTEQKLGNLLTGWTSIKFPGKSLPVSLQQQQFMFREGALKPTLISREHLGKFLLGQGALKFTPYFLRALWEVLVGTRSGKAHPLFLESALGSSCWDKER